MNILASFLKPVFCTFVFLQDKYNLERHQTLIKCVDIKIFFPRDLIIYSLINSCKLTYIYIFYGFYFYNGFNFNKNSNCLQSFLFGEKNGKNQLEFCNIFTVERCVLSIKYAGTGDAVINMLNLGRIPPDIFAYMYIPARIKTYSRAPIVFYNFFRLYSSLFLYQNETNIKSTTNIKVLLHFMFLFP